MVTVTKVPLHVIPNHHGKNSTGVFYCLLFFVFSVKDSGIIEAHGSRLHLTECWPRGGQHGTLAGIGSKEPNNSWTAVLTMQVFQLDHTGYKTFPLLIWGRGMFTALSY